MHHRFIVTSDTSRPTLDIRELAFLTDKTIHYAIEWCSTIKASDTDPLFLGNVANPHAVGLACDDLPDPRSVSTWGGDGVLAILPSYCGSGFYTASDAAYMQTTTLARETQVNLFAARGRLQFHLVKFPHEAWDPVHLEPFSFTFVVWSLEVPRPFGAYHAWISSSDRYVGTAASYSVPFSFTTFEMREDEEWRMAVSHASPIKSSSGASTLLLSVDNLACAMQGNTGVVAFLNGGVRPGEEQWYGLGRGVQPGVHVDTLGTRVETPLYRQGSVRVRLLDEELKEIDDAGEHTFCLSFYRV